jgi:acyl carrier protein
MARMGRAEFQHSLVAFVAALAAGRTRRVVRADTPLFTTGLLDSLKILDLICFVESTLGIRIPDRRVTLGNFKSIRAISDAFCQSQGRDGPG